jgi:hypothetical protein
MSPGQIGYEAYRKESGFNAPRWQDLSDTERRAFEAAAEAVKLAGARKESHIQSHRPAEYLKP